MRYPGFITVHQHTWGKNSTIFISLIKCRVAYEHINATLEVLSKYVIYITVVLS